MTRQRVSRRQYAGFLAGSVVTAGVATSHAAATEHTVSIRHSRSSRTRGTTVSSDGQRSAREYVNIEPGDGTDRIEFGGGTNRVFALVDAATGREVTFTPDPDAETVASDRIRFEVTLDAVEQEDPTITAFTPDREVTTVDIAGSYSGDIEMLSAAAIHPIIVELREDDGSVLATTDRRFVATGYEYTVSIVDETLRVPRASAVDPDWTVEFTLLDDEGAVATTSVANEANSRQFVIDLSSIDVTSAQYDWTIDIIAATNEPATADVVTLSGDQIDPTDPTPNAVTVSGQLTGAFDPDVAAVRAYAPSEGTFTTTRSGNVVTTTRPNTEGAFSLTVPIDQSVSLAYLEVDPETDERIVQNGTPDIHLLTFVSDPPAVGDLGAFEIPEGQNLEITITDAAGDPIEDATVWVRSYDPETNAWVGLYTTTNADGQFQFGDNDPGIEMAGPVQIDVEPDEEDDRIPEMAPFETLTVTQPESRTLRLDPVTVSGRVEAADISDTLVVALAEPDVIVSSILVSSEANDYDFTIQRNQVARLGAYQFDGTYTSPNGLTDIYAIETLTPQAATTVDPTPIPDGDVLEIQVEDSTGDPVPEAFVTIQHRRNDTTVPLTRSVDDNGEFRLGETRAGIEMTGEVEITATGAPRTEFSDEIATASLTVDGPETLTLTLGGDDSEDESPTVAEYADEDGVVRAAGLQNAFSDWAAEEIAASVLQSVFSAWQSGEPVDTTATSQLPQRELSPRRLQPETGRTETSHTTRPIEGDSGSPPR